MKSIGIGSYDGHWDDDGQVVDRRERPWRAGAGSVVTQVYLRAAGDMPPDRTAGMMPYLGGDAALAIAAQGTSGAVGALPYADKMKSAFEGLVDFDALRVYRADAAAQAASALGAHAYAVGDAVALPDGVDEFTTAHELAHVAQHRGGKVQARGLSSPDDADERQADAVAARVVAGEPIASLLSAVAPPSGAVQRRGASEDDLKGAAAGAAGAVMEQSATTRAANAIEQARMLIEASVRDVKAKRVTVAIACASALGTLAGIHQQISTLAQEPRGTMPFEHAVRQLDGLYRACWNLHETAEGAEPYPREADLLWDAMSSIETSGARVNWKAPADSTEMVRRARAETACEPGSEDDLSRRPGCHLEDPKRNRLQTDAKVGLLRLGTIFFDECENHAAALRAAIAKDQAFWGAIAGAAANIIFAVLGGAVATAAGGMVPAAARTGGSVAATTGGHAEGKILVDLAQAGRTGAAVASPPVGVTEFGITIRDLGKKIASDTGKEVWRNRQRDAARSSHDGRSEDERQQTVDALAALSQAFIAHLELASHLIGELDDLQLIELKNSVLDTAGARARSAAWLATFVSDFRREIEPIGTRDHGSTLGRPPNRLLPGDVHVRAVHIEDFTGQKRLALVRHVTDIVPGIRGAGRAAADGIAQGVDAITRDDTYDDDAWREYLEGNGDDFHFIRWIKREEFKPIAGRDAPTIRSGQVQGLSFAASLGAEE